MKKALVVLLVVLASTGLFADFTWMQLNLYEGMGVSDPFGGETYNLTYFISFEEFVYILSFRER